MSGTRAGASLSGFPEWSPRQRWVELRVLDRLRETFELHGFAPLQTRSVEPLGRLVRSAENSKEIYVVSRLADARAPSAAGASPEQLRAMASDEDRLGLHFDLTVPFARWVEENAGRLTFPFKRYQMQQVWRGERPQDGRFREFVQADIDVVAADTLPDHYDVDLPLVALEALRRLDLGDVVVRVSNRRLTEGYLRGLGVDDVPAALAAVDKLAKVGPDGVTELLLAAGLPAVRAEAVLEFAGLRGADAAEGAVRLAARHGAGGPEVEAGAARVAALLAAAGAVAPGAVEADLSIARGLDYYTGTVYETELRGHPDLGSVCSGGRYDELAAAGGVRYPGVGLAVGVTRLLSRVLGAGVRASREVPTCVLVAVDSEETRARSDAAARALRARGIPADTAPTAARYGRQIRHADRLGVPFVWFPGATGEDGAAAPDQVRDIRSGEQVGADAASWEPPAEDRHQVLVAG